MINLMEWLVMMAMLSGILVVINKTIATKKFKDREKSSPFECGFDPFQKSQSPLSVQFFIISVMFLTFDIEIALLIPMIPSMESESPYWLITSMVFLILLMGGLLAEWMENSIKWSG